MRPLSAAGRLASDRLAGVLEPQSITAIYSSPYLRAIQPEG